MSVAAMKCYLLFYLSKQLNYVTLDGEFHMVLFLAVMATYIECELFSLKCELDFRPVAVL